MNLTSPIVQSALLMLLCTEGQRRFPKNPLWKAAADAEVQRLLDAKKGKPA